MKWLIKLFKFIYTRYIFSDYTGQIFMDRYYLVVPPWNEFLRRFPNICLHRFHAKKDYIQEVEHDHARWCFSIILKGGYVEIRNGKRIEYKAFSLSYINSKDVHQIITAEQDTITLFFVGPRFRFVKFFYPKNQNAIAKEQWKEIGITLDRKETPELLKKLDRRRRAFAKLMNNKTVV